MEESKTLVEQLREMVELSIESGQYPALHADAIVGHLCASKSDDRELFTIIADRIEREYLPLPMLEGEPLKVGDKVDGYSEVGAEVVAIMNSEMIVVRSTVKGGSGYHDDAYPLLLWDVRDVKRHRQEVLDADGVPIHVGDHIWYMPGMHYDGIEYVVTEVTNTRLHYKNSEDEYPRGWCLNEHASINITHKQPDTIERIEADAMKTFTDYWGCGDAECHRCPVMVDGKKPYERYDIDGCIKAQKLDLLRRQREVLERGQE